MLKLPVYLDYSATTPVDPRVAKKMIPYLTEIFGNPASRSHAYGWEAEKAVEEARGQVAALINADPREIVWTSGATEADNLALKGAAHFYKDKGKHLITQKTEHKAVLDSMRRLESEGYEVTYLDVDGDGLVDPAAVEAAIRPDTTLVSIMGVNNEIGTIQPIKQIAELAHSVGAKFHTDAVQAVGHMHIDVQEMGIDMLSLSGHKFRGPRGTGVLYVKKGITLEPLVYGGGQERGMRPGTEAVPNIAAFAKACEIRMAHFDEDYAHVQELADYLKQQVSAELPDAVVNGEGDIPHVVNLSMPGCKSEVMLHVLEGDEVYISSGSACSKGKQSGVLKALGLPKARTDSALRVSFAPFNTREDVDAFVAAVKKGAKMFRR